MRAKNLFQILPQQYDTRHITTDHSAWESITRNLMTGTAAQVSLPTEIGGSIKLLVGNVNPFRYHTANQTDTTIQPIISKFVRFFFVRFI